MLDVMYLRRSVSGLGYVLQLSGRGSHRPMVPVPPNIRILVGTELAIVYFVTSLVSRMLQCVV